MTKKLLCSIALLVLGLTSLSFGQAIANPNFPLNANGKVMASEFGKWAFQSLTTITSGAQTVTLNGCYIKVGTAATQFYPIVPSQSLLINDGSNTETVTVTSVTQPVQTPGVSTVNPYACTFTATFANAHQAGFNISSNDGGVYEAASYAQSKGFGTVLVDSTANMTVAQIAALTPLNVTLEDVTGPQTEYFNVQPTTLTAVTVPIPRVGTAATGCTGSNTVCDGTAVGTWTNAAVYFCVTYVDLLGAESPCSTTAHYTTAGSVALNFLAPAAMTGAVGWRAYAGASYATAYQLPITSANCTLTTLETVQPACAVTNASYGQVGSNGVFPTPTVHTQLPPQTGGVAAALNPNTQSHTTFAWVPSLTPGPGFQTNYGPFAKLAALTAGQSVVLATVPLPPGILNYIGRTVRYTGTISLTPTTGGTIQLIGAIGDVTDFTTGTPATICTLTETTATGTAAIKVHFQCDWTVNATGATGSIMPGGFLLEQLQAGTTTGNLGVESATAAATADVLDQDSFFLQFLQTTAAETGGVTLLDLHIELLS